MHPLTYLNSRLCSTINPPPSPPLLITYLPTTLGQLAVTRGVQGVPDHHLRLDQGVSEQEAAVRCVRRPLLQMLRRWVTPTHRYIDR